MGNIVIIYLWEKRKQMNDIIKATHSSYGYNGNQQGIIYSASYFEGREYYEAESNK